MSNEPDDGRVGVGLFGLGRAGRIHLDNIFAKSNCWRLKYVVDAVDMSEYMAGLGSIASNVECLLDKDAGKLFADSSVQAVVICSPTWTHEGIVRQAVASRKAIFCEKPIAETIASTMSCYVMADQAGVPLHCSFNRRFDPSVATLRQRVVDKELGQIYTISTIARDSPFPPIDYLLKSGGIFHDCAVHDIDMICWVIGEYPVSVNVVSHLHRQELKPVNDVDTAFISLKFPSGILGNIELSRNSSHGYDQRLEVFGEKGMLRMENQCPTSVQRYGADGGSFDYMKHSFPERYRESYQNSLEIFHEICRGKQRVTITGDHVVRVSKIAEACEQAKRSGQTVDVDYSV